MYQCRMRNSMLESLYSQLNGHISHNILRLLSAINDVLSQSVVNCPRTNKQTKISICKADEWKKKKYMEKNKDDRNTKRRGLPNKVLLSKLFNELFVYTYLYT